MAPRMWAWSLLALIVLAALVPVQGKRAQPRRGGEQRIEQLEQQLKPEDSQKAPIESEAMNEEETRSVLSPEASMLDKKHSRDTAKKNAEKLHAQDGTTAYAKDDHYKHDDAVLQVHGKVSMRNVRTLVTLSVATSVDNLAVAMAVGLAGMKLSLQDIAIISIAGGLACALSDQVATLAGKWVEGLSRFVGLFLIGLGLAQFWNLYHTTQEDGKEEQQEKNSLFALARKEIGVGSLAIALSVNNLAGGAVGGLAGDAFWQLGLASALATFVFMVGGNYAGLHLGLKLPFRPELLAGAVQLSF